MKTLRVHTLNAVAALHALAAAPHAATEVRGVIEVNERWVVEKSPYLMTDDVLVAKQARLYIGPGVTVLVDRPHSFDPRIKQLDHLDSFTVALRVEGVLTCAGRRESRISFAGKNGNPSQCEWYGVVLDGVLSGESEVAFTDIAGSCNGLMVRKGSPLVHHCVFEYNNIGMTITEGSRVKVLNCAIAYNATCGIRISLANPKIYNNLIVFNRQNGVWSDGVSQMTFENNCVFGHPAGNLAGCDPELGILVKKNEKKDSTDAHENLFKDPIFVGTPAESLSMERDNRIPPRKSQVTDTALAQVLYGTVIDSLPFVRPAATAALRYKLSPYSPCIDAGKKGKAYLDADGSRNDIGMHGGPEFYLVE